MQIGKNRLNWPNKGTHKIYKNKKKIKMKKLIFKIKILDKLKKQYKEQRHQKYNMMTMVKNKIMSKANKCQKNILMKNRWM